MSFFSSYAADASSDAFEQTRALTCLPLLAPLLMRQIWISRKGFLRFSSSLGWKLIVFARIVNHQESFGTGRRGC
jgi:hypothetical protein